MRVAGRKNLPTNTGKSRKSPGISHRCFYIAYRSSNGSKRNLNSADPLMVTGHWALGTGGALQLQPSLVLARGSFMGVIIIQ